MKNSTGVDIPVIQTTTKKNCTHLLYLLCKCRFLSLVSFSVSFLSYANRSSVWILCQSSSGDVPALLLLLLLFSVLSADGRRTVKTKTSPPPLAWISEHSCSRQTQFQQPSTLCSVAAAVSLSLSPAAVNLFFLKPRWTLAFFSLSLALIFFLLVQVRSLVVWDLTSAI